MMRDPARKTIIALVFIFSTIDIGSSFVIIALIIYHRKKHPIGSCQLLSCNTYLAVLISCYSVLDAYIYLWNSSSNSFLSSSNDWCYARAYLIHSGLSSIYHSQVLQAFYRFIRIVLFKHKYLQSLRFTVILIVLQWIFVCSTILILLLFHHFEYIPYYHFCQISFKNLTGLIIAAVNGYELPLILIASLYFYIIYFIKRTNSFTNYNRPRLYRRDLVVFNRVLTLIFVLVFFCFPAILLWIIYIITGNLHPLIYHVQWLFFSFSLAFLPATSVMITTDLQYLIRIRPQRMSQVRPITHVQQNQNDYRLKRI